MNNDDSIDDVVFEETPEGEGEAHSQDKIKKLKADLKEEKSKSAEYLLNWQKERADFVNYKKEELARLSRAGQSAKERFLEDLLPVLDAYDLAFSNKEAWEKVDANWRIGVEYIHSQLLKVLAENDVLPIDVKMGDNFDANTHESVDNIKTENEDDDQKIAEIVQSGYKLKDSVLRPARVKVFVKN